MCVCVCTGCRTWGTKCVCTCKKVFGVCTCRKGREFHSFLMQGECIGRGECNCVCVCSASGGQDDVNSQPPRDADSDIRSEVL